MSHELPTTWDYDEIVAMRHQYLSPSLETFVAFEDPYLVLKRGEGQYLYDHNDKQYVDFLAQNLCISVGYNNPVVTRAVNEQMRQLQHATTMWFNPVPGHFAKELLATFPDQDYVVHFLNSGAEAADLALMLARLYSGNFDFCCLRKAYHGLHFGPMSMTGIDACRQPLPAAPGIFHIENPDAYRGIWGTDVDAYIDDYERAIKSTTPGSIAGFIAEPIQGFGGVMPLPPGYLKRAFELTKACGGVTIADEVQTGFGRTGTNFWGFQNHDVVPDMIVLGKGIGNGFPISALVVKREIAQAMCQRKFFNTYGSNLVGCAAGHAVLKVIEDEQLMANAQRVGQHLKQGLQTLKDKHPLIGDIRGQGLMQGVEIVSDQVKKTPAPEENQRIHSLAKDQGVIMGRGGAHGNCLRLNPPLCVNTGDVDRLLSALDYALTHV